MMPEAELRAMRATQRQVMPDTATVYDVAVVNDGMGGSTESWAPRAVSVPVRIGQPQAGQAQAVADRVQGSDLFMGSMPHGTPVERGDRLEVTTGDVTVIYEVVGVEDPESYDTAVRVLLARVDD